MESIAHSLRVFSRLRRQYAKSLHLNETSADQLIGARWLLELLLLFAQFAPPMGHNRLAPFDVLLPKLYCFGQVARRLIAALPVAGDHQFVIFYCCLCEADHDANRARIGSFDRPL